MLTTEKLIKLGFRFSDKDTMTRRISDATNFHISIGFDDAQVFIEGITINNNDTVTDLEPLLLYGSIYNEQRLKSLYFNITQKSLTDE